MKRSRLFKYVGAAAAIAAGAYVVTRDSLFSGGKCSEEAYRKRVVEFAMAQVGKRDLDTYFADAAPQYVGDAKVPEWCGIFDLYVLHQVGLAKEKSWKTGYGFLEVPPRLPNTTTPKPGDIAYFAKYSHHAIVAEVHNDGTLTTVNGNGAGGVVSIGHPKVSDAHAYYSISKLIEEAQKTC